MKLKKIDTMNSSIGCLSWYSDKTAKFWFKKKEPYRLQITVAYNKVKEVITKSWCTCDWSISCFFCSTVFLIAIMIYDLKKNFFFFQKIRLSGTNKLFDEMPMRFFLTANVILLKMALMRLDTFAYILPFKLFNTPNTDAKKTFPVDLFCRQTFIEGFSCKVWLHWS